MASGVEGNDLHSKQGCRFHRLERESRGDQSQKSEKGKLDTFFPSAKNWPLGGMESGGEVKGKSVKKKKD